MSVEIFRINCVTAFFRTFGFRQDVGTVAGSGDAGPGSGRIDPLNHGYDGPAPRSVPA